MSIRPYSNEELNFFKFTSIVLNEFPKALRQLFADLWNIRIAPRPGNKSWDDSIAVRNMLLKSEGPKTKIPTNISYQQWDCTALFQATLYSKTFALPDSMGNMKSLDELYLKNRKPLPGSFHSPVVSPSGNQNETTALAIDQLRLLRNTLCHSPSPRVDKVTFDQYVQSTKDAFTAVNLSTKTLEIIGNQSESDFPTSRVQQLEKKIKQEQNVFNEFLKSEVVDTVEEGNRRIEAKLTTHTIIILLFIVFIIFVGGMWVNLSAGPLQATSQSPQGFLTSVEKFNKPMSKAVPSTKDSYDGSQDCLRATRNSPIGDLQEFDFSSHLRIARKEFVGRKWLFQELEDLFNNNGDAYTGAVILGDPGSGKSAIMSQLICSPTSSVFIHENIIAYHICDFAEKGTRDGARFVRNLVSQIARDIPEYSVHIRKSEIIRKVLDTRCERDPTGCFHTAIIGPLIKLESSTKFILIDALDECLEKSDGSSNILRILQSPKLITHLPDWIKIILSSRNKTSFTAKLPKTFARIAINSTNKRNLEDIRSYAEQITPPHYQYKSGTKKKKDLKGLIDKLFKISEGNFLYFKTLLEYYGKHGDKIGPQSFPPSLDHLYAYSFRNRFGKSDFERFTPLLEVLLASNAPPTMSKLEAILKFRTDKYETGRVIRQVYEYLITGSDGTVRFYHQSFANRLMNQTEDIDGLFIQISRGHQYIVDYLFDYFHQRNTTLTLQELSELSMHVLFGGMVERQVSKLQGLDISKIRDSRIDKYILHDLALKRESTPIIKIFSQKFDSVDILDRRDWTPAFYAAYEGNFENLKLFIDEGTNVSYVTECPNYTCEPEYVFPNPRTVLDCGSSIVFIAAIKGYTKIVETLINERADFNKANVFGRKPLHLAAEHGHLDIVKLLHDNGAVADAIALHHAAARNHSNITRFLLDIGIRDVCLPCKPGNISSCYNSRNISLHQSHLCFCETALHAAVSRGLLNIVKLMLSYGNASLECKHHSGKTPFLDAVERNDIEMVTLLLNEGANAEGKCENEISNKLINRYKCEKSLFDNEERDFLYTRYCDKDVCSCGSTSIHLSARHGLWDMAKELISRWNASGFSVRNCQGLTAVSFAAIHDRADFIHNLDTTTGGMITKFILNNKYDLRHIVVCGSMKTLKLLSSNAHISDFTMVYDHGMTLLHLAAMWSPYPEPHTSLHTTGYREIRSCSEVINNNACFLMNRTCFSQRHVENEYKRRLITVRLLTKLQQNISKTDDYGKTALHYAAERGFAGAVRHLGRQGSDWRVKDQNGYTPLELALIRSPPLPEFFLPCRMTSDGVFRSCNSTMFDETARYLIKLQKSSIKKCNTDTERLLRLLLEKRMPLSLYSFFKIGVDVNCGVGLFKFQLKFLLNTRGQEINEVFKIFEVNVNVECGVPVQDSELHLLANLAMPNDMGNFFKPSVNNLSFPLQRLINSHPKGFRVLDECRDEEGYLAIHRAVQGGNVDAVNWFVSLGVDIFKKTRSGWNALDLSIYYLVPERYSRLTKANYKDASLLSTFYRISPGHRSLYIRIGLFYNFIEIVSLHVVQNLRERIFEILLVQYFKKMNNKGSASFSWCKPEFTALSPLHIAASRGMKMLEYVHKKGRRLPISCTNKHGIESRYLAYLYESVEDHDIKRNVFLQNLDLPNKEGSLQYPEQEAEYHLIYNHFFQTPDVDLSFELDFEGLFECPGINDILPNRTVINTQIKQCYNRCWESASQVSHKFVSAFPNIPIENNIFDLFDDGFFDIVVQMSELRHLSVKRFYKIPSRLWRQISKAYSCSYRCRCIEIMRLLQEQFTSQPRRDRRVGKFAAERMGWNDTSTDGDVLHRWPFRFLLKKALKKDKDYEYLKIIGEDFNIDSFFL